MRLPVISMLCLALAAPLVARAADPEPVAPAETSVPPPESTVTPAAPPAVAPPPAKPKPAPKPRVTSKPAAAVAPAPEPPKPAEKLPEAAARSDNGGVNQPGVTPAPAVVSPSAADAGSSAATGRSIGCLALSFAMLILGFIGGFVGRHLLSRHKLGGMTVRIGTWRGIP